MNHSTPARRSQRTAAAIQITTAQQGRKAGDSMNAEQAQQAENRNTWTSEAGPIQTKRVEKALSKFRQASIGYIELWGTRGEDEHRSHIVELGLGSGGSPMVPASVEKLQSIGEAYGWTITSKNHKEIIGELEEAAKGVELPIVDKLRSPETVAKEKAEQAERDAARKQAQAARDEDWSKIIAKAPANATAVIVAEYEVDDCDSMTDYFNATTDRRVVIGFRTGKREDFKQLRAAAAGFEETKHLGPGCERWTIRAIDKGDGMHHVPYDLQRAEYATEAEALDAIEQSEGTAGLDQYEARSESIEHRENYSMGAGNYLKSGHRYSTGWAVRSRALSTSTHYDHEDGVPEKAVHEASTDHSPALEGAGYSIQTHYHTKRETDFYIVVLDDRVERSEFDAIRSSCKAAGGWYSRKWGSTPGGFAFMDRTAAENWARSEFGGDAPTDPDGDRYPLAEGESFAAPFGGAPAPGCGPKNDGRHRQAAAFRVLADRLGKDTDAGQRTENTPKQRRQASLARANASNAQHAQTAAAAIADALEAGTLPDSLKSVPCTLAGLKKITARRIESGPGYYDTFYPTDELEVEDSQAETLRDWIQGLGKDTGPTPEELKAQAERASVLHEKIPGFFPTPTEAAQRMVEAAGLSTGDCVLEPSAGRGDLADAIEEAIGPAGVLHCIEVNQRLAALHSSETRPVHCLDFTEQDPRDWDQCDAVIMNPPFENGQDRQHILHAWEFLKPGGCLVAICSPGSLTNSRGNYINGFKRWFSDHDVEVLDKEVGGFAATKIQAVMIRAYKPQD